MCGGDFGRLRSVQQLVKLALFKLSIVSDFIKCVHLHNLSVLKNRVQQVLNRNENKTGRIRVKQKKRERKEKKELKKGR